MLLDNIKKTIGFVIVLSIFANTADAADDIKKDDMSAKVSAMDKLKADHLKKMLEIEHEFADKLANYSSEKMKMRLMATYLKEARMRARDKYNEQLMNRKLSLSKAQYERYNPYIIKKEARDRYFKNKE